MSDKKFGTLTQELLDSLFIIHNNFDIQHPRFVDWDFINNNDTPQTLFKAGDSYVHSISGSGSYADDMYSYDSTITNPTPSDCKAFSDDKLAPRWKFEIEPTFYYKTKWDETSMRTGYICRIYRNNILFTTERAYDDNDAYIMGKAKLSRIFSQTMINFKSRKWKDELTNRKIWYRDEPAIITSLSHSNNGYDFYISPDIEKIKEFSRKGWWTEEDVSDWGYGDGTSADFLDHGINWFRN